MTTKAKPATAARPLILFPHEVRQVLREGVVQVWRPVFRDDPRGHMPWRVSGTHWQDGDDMLRCPFGEPGTRLYVKEPTWLPPIVTQRMLREGADTWPRVIYGDDESDWCREHGWGRLIANNVSKHLSRLTLTTEAVRVARVQKITGEDAKAAGADSRTDLSWKGTTETRNFYAKGFIAGFRKLWDARYAAKGLGWTENPWCWAATCRRVEGEATG